MSTGPEALAVTGPVPGGLSPRVGPAGARIERLPASPAFVGAVLCMAVGTGIGLWILGLDARLAVALAGGAVGAAAALGSLQLGMALLLIVVATFQRDELFQTSVPFFGGGLKPTDLLLVAILAGWAVRSLLENAAVRGRRRATVEPPRHVSILLGAFVAWALVSCGLAISNGVFFKDSMLELRPLLQYLLFVPLATSLGRDQIRHLVWVIIAASAATSVRGLLLYVGGGGHAALFAAGSNRITEIEFAYVLFALVFAVVLHAGDHRLRWTWPFLATIALGGLVVTFYRAAWLGVMGACGFAFLVTDRDGRRGMIRFFATIAVLVPLAVAAIGLRATGGTSLAASVGSRIASIGEYKSDISAQHRLREWQAAAAGIREQPIVGSGLGTRVGFYSPMYNERTAGMGYWSDDLFMHNSYFWFVLKLGFVGFLLFAAAVGLTLRTGLEALRRMPQDTDRSLLLGLVSCIVALVVVSFFGPMFNLDNLTPFVVFALAAIHVLARPAAGTGPDDATANDRADASGHRPGSGLAVTRRPGLA